jgi:hypothetical protein
LQNLPIGFDHLSWISPIYSGAPSNRRQTDSSFEDFDMSQPHSADARLRRRSLAVSLTMTLTAVSPALCIDDSRAASAAIDHHALDHRVVAASAPSLTVENCDDDGDGSLRAAIAAAPESATIDLTALGCSTITLTTGHITIAQADLALMGPGAGTLSIDAGAAFSVLRHTGEGTLSISGLTIANGTYRSAATPKGGCIYSAGGIELENAIVSGCTLEGLDGSQSALGGAIYARGDLVLAESTVESSKAHGTVPGSGGFGGGVYVAGDLTALGSAISGNAAYGAPINNSAGGGVFVAGTTSLTGTTVAYNGAFGAGGVYTLGDVTIESSTISSNTASSAAGMRAAYSDGSPFVTIVNSTIAANHSFGSVGGLNLLVAAKIANSTIALNDANNGLAGLLMSGPTLELESTIIAGNTRAGDTPDDFAGFGSPAITGQDNLVVASTDPMPPGTIMSDPVLGDLGDYGGPTATIALLEGSPAINAGNNLAALAHDQRGFVRVSGARADIGAFEVQVDGIFTDGFDPSEP